MKIITGQLERMDSILGNHTFLSASYCSLYFYIYIDNSSNINPISSGWSYLLSIFLSVWVMMTVGVVCTLNLPNVYGHLAASRL
jgi:hypothetical protein